MKENAIGAAKACFELAGKEGITNVGKWSSAYQGGAYWASYECYLTAARDVLGLKLPSHDKYKVWERCAIAAPFRVMHEDFCIVSDFPVHIKMDEQNRPHCEDGPSHLWRDGWALYHWHGTAVPENWILEKTSLSAAEAIKWSNIEQRRAAFEILGYEKIFQELGGKIIDEDIDPEVGTLIEVVIPDIGTEKFLRVQCGTGRKFTLPVPPEMKTALDAQAWTWVLDNTNFNKPEIRT